MRMHSMPIQEAIMPRVSAKFAIVIGAMTAVIPTLLLALDVNYLCFVPFMLGLFCLSVGVMSLGSGQKVGRLVGWSALALSTFAIVFPFGAIAISNRPGHDIVYVIPHGYRGP